MTTQMCLTFAGDEAGDASFSFDKGASSHFVLALIATAQPDALRQKLAHFRNKRGLPAQYEFKYHALSSVALRQAIFQTLAVMDLAVWALSVDKTRLPTWLRAVDAHGFYALMASELIAQVPLTERECGLLLLDQFDPGGRSLLALKRALKQREICRGFRKMVNVRSRSEPLVQIADLVAGAILRHVAHGDSESLICIRDRIRLIHRFEAGQKNPPS